MSVPMVSGLVYLMDGSGISVSLLLVAEMANFWVVSPFPVLIFWSAIGCRVPFSGIEMLPMAASVGAWVPGPPPPPPPKPPVKPSMKPSVWTTGEPDNSTWFSSRSTAGRDRRRRREVAHDRRDARFTPSPGRSE